MEGWETKEATGNEAAGWRRTGEADYELGPGRNQPSSLTPPILSRIGIISADPVGINWKRILKTDAGTPVETFPFD